MGRKKRRTAANSDKYDLYELSVQEPEADCDVVEQVWKEIRGRKPVHMREDFCATAITAIEWVKRGGRNTAVAIDLDPTVLELAGERIKARLKPAQRKRIELIEANVLTVEIEPVDCILATNFSYYIFKTRQRMKKYFKRVHKALVGDGLFILDAYGGSDSFLEMEESRECDGFDFIWDQKHYNPITGDVINHIHFDFPNGSKMKSAFVYEWRLWTIPELREMLKESGFQGVTVYWEGTDKDGEGNGEWSPSKVGEACEGWVAYLVAEK